MTIDFFVYFNPNPGAKTKKDGTPKRHDRDDCTIRAVCAATGMSWIDAYKFVCAKTLEVFDVPSGTNGFIHVLESLGFEKVSYKRGSKRDTVCDLAAKSYGKIIIANVAGHVVCCKNGFYYDTHRCGYQTAYNYWVKDTENNYESNH